MASAGAVASGFRQHLCRSSSHPFLCSSRLRHNGGLRTPTLLSALSFSPSASHRPSVSYPLSPAQSRFSLSTSGFRRVFSAAVAGSTPDTRTSVLRSLEEDDDEGEDEFDAISDNDGEDGEEEEAAEEEEDEEGESIVLDLPRYPSPVLSVKEKKELASYAHSLGKKLKSQQVGKSGITPSVVSAFIDTLEANELLKLKVHANCPGELPDVIRLLEASTGSVAVGRIGRSVILYRPSISKMQEAQEKRAVKRPWKPRPYKGGSSSLGGQKDGVRRPFLRQSSRRPAKA